MKFLSIMTLISRCSKNFLGFRPSPLHTVQGTQCEGEGGGTTSCPPKTIGFLFPPTFVRSLTVWSCDVGSVHPQPQPFIEGPSLMAPLASIPTAGWRGPRWWHSSSSRGWPWTSPTKSPTSRPTPPPGEAEDDVGRRFPLAVSHQRLRRVFSFCFKFCHFSPDGIGLLLDLRFCSLFIHTKNHAVLHASVEFRFSTHRAFTHCKFTQWSYLSLYLQAHPSLFAVLSPSPTSRQQPSASPPPGPQRRGDDEAPCGGRRELPRRPPPAAAGGAHAATAPRPIGGPVEWQESEWWGT